MKLTSAKKVFYTILLLTFTLSAHAGPKITDARTGGFLYGFLTTIEKAQNAGDGVLVVSAEVSCAKHISNDQYYCMSDVGGITGDLAELVYKSFSKKTEERFENVITRQGNVGCASIEESGKETRFNCY